MPQTAPRPAVLLPSTWGHRGQPGAGTAALWLPPPAEPPPAPRAARKSHTYGARCEPSLIFKSWLQPCNNRAAHGEPGPCTQPYNNKPTSANACVREGKVWLRNCFYFQGQLRATGGSVTQKYPLDRARPITAEEFQIPRISRSLARRNEVFSAPTRLQRFLFAPRLQQQPSFKAQTPALHPGQLQPREAKQTRSDVRRGAGPTLCHLTLGTRGLGKSTCPQPSGEVRAEFLNSQE